MGFFQAISNCQPVRAPTEPMAIAPGVARSVVIAQSDYSMVIGWGCQFSPVSRFDGPKKVGWSRSMQRDSFELLGEDPPSGMRLRLSGPRGGIEGYRRLSPWDKSVRGSVGERVL